MNTQPNGRRNLFWTILLILVCLFLPLIGHIILTVMIARDYLTLPEKVIWLVAVWAIPVLGPLLYLLVGQRSNRLFGGHPLFERRTPEYPQY
ncbi:MAG TPA: PLD nuclease N-terminal domain-containing protein [Ktedonobacterales bacterium]